MSKIRFQLVTPEKTVLDEELDSLSCPTGLGQITILPNHEPLIANLKPGELIARAGGQERNIHVSGGFVEVRPKNQVVILADSAEHSNEIDETRALAAMQRAKSALAEKTLSDEEYAKVAAALERSLSRLNVVRKRRPRHAPITGETVLKE